MSQAGSERGEGGAIDDQDELTEVVADLRAELSSLAQRVARRDDVRTDELLRAVDGQRAAVAEAVASLARDLGGQLQQVESQVVQLAARTAALEDVQQSLGRVRDAIAVLSTRADRNDETSQRIADEHALALARVTAATDGLAITVGAIRGAIGTVVGDARDATVASIDARVGARADEAATQVESALTSHLDAALAALGITQLRQSVAEVAAQVVESRADARTINESIAAFDARVAQTTAAAILPLTTALGRVRQQVEAIPAPDLGPVATQLARLSAMVLAQARNDLASSADVEAVRTSLEASLNGFSQQLEREAAATAAIAGGFAEELRTAITAQLTQQLTESDAARQAGIEQLATQLSQADAARQAGIEQLSQQLREQLRRADEQRTAFTEQVTNHLSHADVALRAGIEVILAEVATAREAAERRTGSRWRRGPVEDQPPGTTAAGRAMPPELEQRIDQALRDLDHRLTAVAQLAERASAFADDAAQAAIATFRAVNALRPQLSVPPAKTSPRKAAAPGKKSVTKKQPTKAAAAAKRSTKKAATASTRTTTKPRHP